MVLRPPIPFHVTSGCIDLDAMTLNEHTARQALSFYIKRQRSSAPLIRVEQFHHRGTGQFHAVDTVWKVKKEQRGNLNSVASLS